MRPALVLLVGLAACSSSTPPPSTAEAACQQRIYDDPVVKETLLKAADPDWMWQNAPKVEIVKQQAIARCLQGRGARVRGGVERPL